MICSRLGLSVSEGGSPSAAGVGSCLALPRQATTVPLGLAKALRQAIKQIGELFPPLLLTAEPQRFRKCRLEEATPLNFFKDYTVQYENFSLPSNLQICLDTEKTRCENYAPFPPELPI